MGQAAGQQIRYWPCVHRSRAEAPGAANSFGMVNRGDSVRPVVKVAANERQTALLNVRKNRTSPTE